MLVGQALRAVTGEGRGDGGRGGGGKRQLVLRKETGPVRTAPRLSTSRRRPRRDRAATASSGDDHVPSEQLVCDCTSLLTAEKLVVGCVERMRKSDMDKGRLAVQIAKRWVRLHDRKATTPTRQHQLTSCCSCLLNSSA